MFYSNYSGCSVESGAELGRDSNRRAGRQLRCCWDNSLERENGGLGQSWVLNVRTIDIWAQISPGCIFGAGGGAGWGLRLSHATWLASLYLLDNSSPPALPPPQSCQSKIYPEVARCTLEGKGAKLSLVQNLGI